MGLVAVLLVFLPLLALVAAMLVWPYPGADLIEALVLRRRRPGPRPASRPAPCRRAPRGMPHGGLLLSLSLGGRAPPVSLGRA